MRSIPFSASRAGCSNCGRCSSKAAEPQTKARIASRPPKNKCGLPRRLHELNQQHTRSPALVKSEQFENAEPADGAGRTAIGASDHKDGGSADRAGCGVGESVIAWMKTVCRNRPAAGWSLAEPQICWWPRQYTRINAQPRQAGLRSFGSYIAFIQGGRCWDSSQLRQQRMRWKRSKALQRPPAPSAQRWQRTPQKTAKLMAKLTWRASRRKGFDMATPVKIMPDHRCPPTL